ncbi:helicase C-terminal domain-containing protein [Leadbettera azotonutricia]|uniref:DinG-like protein n=1 Tax=Leadbettera azotonutricia (strain ATCC BAA-888 / DSM 13862 / ZAS-9) TaxID=545695 RepID=F5YBJ5_LEAAZ|nr:helicase C-terminal domain-containing protein [Leadbettera azotonutricia]AEF80530.1 DinG-like protein [Leadbettera azotonutricia ZAS-9]
MQAIKRFTEQAINKLREEIQDTGGNEVFALGYMDDANKIAKIEIAARGNVNSVLALQDRLDDIFDDPEAESASPDVLIHNHPSGFLTPSDPDMNIASRAAQGGVGSFIVDNMVTSVYVVAEPAKRRKSQKLDPEAITAALEEGGAIARRLPVFETRKSQLDLMHLAIKAFNDDSIAAAEAGTGVGKSFAYLLPALSYAMANDERIVISTATITLQQQLYEKDIPLVAAGLNSKLKVVLVKGRGNYLCLRRMEEVLKEPSLDEEENENLRSIVLWAETSKTGDRADLSFMPMEGLWSRICSEADSCMGMRCPFRERCFMLAMRREAADARILVVNHHLLFADLAARMEGAGYDSTVVLPPYNRVIIDEAHTIEEAATSFFSDEFSRFGIYRNLSRLYRKRRAQKTGLILKLMGMLPGNAAFAEDDKNKIEDIIENIRQAVDDLDEGAVELCGREGVFRLAPQKDDYIRTGLSPQFISLRKQINILGGIIRDMLEKIPEAENKKIDTAQEGTVWEVKAILRRLDTIGNVCSSFLEYKENPGKVMWIEKRQGSSDKHSKDPWAEFTVSPLDVAPVLKEALFAPNKTVICVSATLTIGGRGEASFSYWKNRSGLALVQDREILSGIFPSPFPYKSKVLLAVPSDAPLPTEGGFSAFVDNAAADLAESAGGSALILFTSYTALRSAYELAKPRLQQAGIRVLKQGDDDRSRLLANFLSDESSVLFATDSFWEGVDAPGDTLRLVILCRLPFRTPSDPVFEARCEHLEAEGGNAFMDLSLPEAVMKFKQGFGRLMRRSSDHGVVAVLDGRLLKKRYGQTFLNSLPETRTCFGDFKAISRATEEFLFP